MRHDSTKPAAVLATLKTISEGGNLSEAADSGGGGASGGYYGGGGFGGGGEPR